MNDELHVEVPADLADELIGKGFEEFFALRGFLAEAVTVMAVASAGLAAGANAVTIIVSRAELSEFLAVVHAWVQRKSTCQPNGEFAVDISAKQGIETTRLRLEITSKSGTPEIDIATLTTFITALFSDETSRKAISKPD